jgi:hypothetical protein
VTNRKKSVKKAKKAIFWRSSSDLGGHTRSECRKGWQKEEKFVWGMAPMWPGTKRN